MLGTFAFAEMPFATLQVAALKRKVGGTVSVSRKKKYNWYTIFGKQYKLTEQEYQRYQLQRQAYEAELKDKTDNELIDLMDSAEAGEIPNRLAALIRDPVFKVFNLEIPLIPEGLLEKVNALAIHRLLAKLKREQEEDDEAAIEMLIASEYI